MKKEDKRGSTIKNIALLYADPMILKTLRCLFQDLNGYEVHEVFQTGRNALHYLSSGAKVDLLLVGCYLQDMDTAQFLRKWESQKKGSGPYIILTGPARYIDLIHRGPLSNSVDYYMIEPYHPNDLLKAVELFSPARCFAKNTPWDKYIHLQLESLGVSKTMEGYWYLGGCLQEWLLLSNQAGVPQMKSILPEVARFHRVEPKAVESGIQRVLSQLKRKEVIPPNCYRMKPFLGWLADQVRMQFIQEGLDEHYAGESGTATV